MTLLNLLCLLMILQKLKDLLKSHNPFYYEYQKQLRLNLDFLKYLPLKLSEKEHGNNIVLKIIVEKFFKIER